MASARLSARAEAEPGDVGPGLWEGEAKALPGARVGDVDDVFDRAAVPANLQQPSGGNSEVGPLPSISGGEGRGRAAFVGLSPPQTLPPPRSSPWRRSGKLP